MVNVQLSPGDPLFWLHHSWLDSLWWKWQSQKLEARIKDMTGPNMPPQATFNFSTPGASFGFPPGQGPAPGCFGGFVPTPNGTFQLPNGTNAGNVTRPTTPLQGGPPGSNPNATNPFGGGATFNPIFAFKENKAITAYFGDGGGKIATMNHTLWSAGVFPNATIGDVMDVRGPFVCSEYVYQ
jgi:tyrosinase